MALPPSLSSTRSCDDLAVVVLTQAAMETAQTLCQSLPGAQLHGLSSRLALPPGAVGFDDTLDHLQALFSRGTAIVALCASGIVIRALAPVLADKQDEPPVLALSPDGGSVVPLLGGHHGANALARDIAQMFNGHAAVTTGGDVVFGVALDAPPSGWTLGNPQNAKAVMAAVLGGASVALDMDADLDPALAEWLTGSALPFDPAGAVRLKVTCRAAVGDENTLVYYPPVLAVGVGCERDTPDAELTAAVDDLLTSNGLSPHAVGAVVSIDLKADEAAVHAVAKALGQTARFYSAERLEQETPRLATPSDVVFAEVGCHGVAEGAALAAVGMDGRLLLPKQKGQRTTCALGLAATGLPAETVGRPRGKLTVVGIGPGTPEWRTPAVTAAVSGASDLVGYGLYLDLLGGLTDGKVRHQTDLGKEEDRARRALELAAEGKEVCLVCSGDAGIFALATLVYELLDHEKRPEWKTIDVAVEPGVSAIQAAAARAGAPIGHDFCLLSLSDLLTPRDVVLKRIRAVGEGDFVVGFYNPVSLRRRDLLASARDILLTHRPADTPVILARNLGRDEETITVVRLADLTVDMADMLTLVLVGNSESRWFRHGGADCVYTPRGYGDKWKRA